MTTLADLGMRPHQEDALRKIHQLGGKAGLFISMGGGKTRVALQYARVLRCNRVLVVCPASVSSVWEREAKLIGWNLKLIHLTDWPTVQERADIMKRLNRLRQLPHEGDAIVTVNYESYWRTPLRDAIVRWAPDAVILDEVHRIRHRGSRQARFAGIVGALPSVRVRLGLSGTPSTNGLQDVWSIYRFIDPKVFGSRWVDFANRYLIMGGFEFRSIKGYQNVEEAHAKLAASSFQWEGQAFETPPDVPIMVHLSEATRAQYAELKKKAIAKIHDTATETDKVVVAKIALTLLLRLQQIACGFTKAVGEELVEVGTEKATATIELIEDAVTQKQQVVVFARFLHDLDLLQRMMPKTFRVTRIDGDVPVKERERRRDDFDHGLYDVILCQIKAASLGIDLAAAKIAIFYSVGFSLDEFMQAKGRLSGALRQRHSVTFYHMLAADTVDERVYRALSDKIKIAQRITDLNYALGLFG